MEFRLDDQYPPSNTIFSRVGYKGAPVANKVNRSISAMHKIPI